MRHATILVFDNCYASSVTAITDVLKVANQLWKSENNNAQPLFSWSLVSADAKTVTSSSGLKLGVDGTIEEEKPDVVFIPACHYHNSPQILRETEKISDWSGNWLINQYENGVWLTAGCSGAFVLGNAGLLDGKAATTSWWLTHIFQKKFPKVKLQSDELVTEDERLISAGPVNSHFNLALRLVERVAGQNLALYCAKTMLIDANRPSQLPYVVLQTQTQHTDDLVLRAQEWMRQHLTDSFGIEEVAKAIYASQRNFKRRFKRATGFTPSEYLQDLRIETAKHLLETTDFSLESIVERVGYQDTSSFRRLFKQRTTLSPREYRQRFAIGRMNSRVNSINKTDSPLNMRIGKKSIQ